MCIAPRRSMVVVRAISRQDIYADCDAPRHEVQSLITLEDVVPDHFETQFVVWRDPDSPRLTFRVAFLYSYYRKFIICYLSSN
jgi:hypothetical protein